MFPRISICGGPRERGRQYGAAAAERVQRSVAAYADVFAHYAGWSWPCVRAEAQRFEAPLERHCPIYLEEIRGIAEGAAVDALDILAINVRTEVMFAATVRDASAMRLPAECSSFAVLPQRSGCGSLLIGQNWDWLVHSLDTVVVLEVEQDSGPDFVTVVEAGLLAKCGMNSCGVAVATNALVSDADVGRPGLPYHVLLRALLDCETVSDALALLQRHERSSSGNYLIANEDGLAIDVEAVAGDCTRLFLQHSVDGIILHTNHFLSPQYSGQDVSLLVMPDSPFRLDRLRELVGDAAGTIEVEDLQRALEDHVGFPAGLCCHPDPRLPGPEQSMTAASIIMDVGARHMWLASGSPCTTPFELLDYAELLAEPSHQKSAP